MIGKLTLRCQVAVLSVAVIAPVTLAQENVLLIPDVLTETVGKYSPGDGRYLGDVIPNDGRMEEVHCVVLGPDGLLYVADQFHGKIFRYESDGTFVDTFVDTQLNGGLVGPTGMDFLFDTDGSHSLIVALQTSAGNGRIARYLADGTFDAGFLGTPIFTSIVFDVMVDNDNSLWYAVVGTGSSFSNGGFGRFDPSGQDLGIILPARFPNQVIRCPTGNYMGSVLAGYFFGLPHFHEFAHDGTIIASWDIPGAIPAPHGISKLDNGMLLSVGDSGVWQVDPANDNSTTLIRSGSGFRMVHRATLPDSCPVDVNGNGAVGINDFLAVLAAWGPCGSRCPRADINRDGVVGIDDFLAVLAEWGPCA